MTELDEVAAAMWADKNRHTLACWDDCLRLVVQKMDADETSAVLNGVADALWKIVLTQPKESVMDPKNVAFNAAAVPPLSAALEDLGRAINAHDALLLALENRLAPVSCALPQPLGSTQPQPEGTAPKAPVVVELNCLAAYVRRQSDKVEEMLNSLQV